MIMGRKPPAGPVLADDGFEARRLHPDASLNRLVISEHVGAPPDIVGREARSLLSAAAVRDLGAAHGLSAGPRLGGR